MNSKCCVQLCGFTSEAVLVFLQFDWSELGYLSHLSFFYSIHTTKHIFAAKIQFFRERCKKIYGNFADEDLFVTFQRN